MSGAGIRLDIHADSRRGGRLRNQDVLRHVSGKGDLTAVLCDGIGGGAGGENVAGWCTGWLLEKLTGQAAADGLAVSRALEDVQERLLERKSRQPGLRQAGCTASVLLVRDGQVVWGVVGDSRVYRFSGCRLAAVSEDDTVAYQAYLRNELAYHAIRLDDRRSVLTACLGDERPFTPHVCAGEVRAGDAMLICSDGFWAFVGEIEMQADLCKTTTAAEWCERMLLRHARRSFFDGDNLSVLVCRVGSDRDQDRKQTGV